MLRYGFILAGIIAAIVMAAQFYSVDAAASKAVKTYITALNVV